eukprot:Nk52_evm65s1020 gene=Nk52_evmTU65s1020
MSEIPGAIHPPPSGSEEWSVKDKLLLAQAVYRIGDANWVGVSRALKPHIEMEQNHSKFSQKSCASAYASLLETVKTPKRKRNDVKNMTSPLVQITGRLYVEYLTILENTIEDDRKEYAILMKYLSEVQDGKRDNELENMITNENYFSGLISRRPAKTAAALNVVDGMTGSSNKEDVAVLHSSTKESASSPKKRVDAKAGVVAEGKTIKQEPELETVSEEQTPTAPARRGRKPKKAQTSVPPRPASTRRSRRHPGTGENSGDGTTTPVNETTIDDGENSLLLDSKAMDSQFSAPPSKNWKKAMLMVWRDIANHKDANVFMNPVKPETAKDYYKLIKKPVCLASIKKDVDAGVITTTKSFLVAMLQMCQNAIQYNGEEHHYNQIARSFREDIKMRVNEFELAQRDIAAQLDDKIGAEGVEPDAENSGLKKKVDESSSGPNSGMSSPKKTKKRKGTPDDASSRRSRRRTSNQTPTHRETPASTRPRRARRGAANQ